MSSSFLKGLIFKEGDNPKTEDGDQSKVAGTTEKTITPVVGDQTFANQTTVQGVVDNKFVEVLTAVIEENNLPGQDYFEFKQAIENMKSLAMNDQQKFQTVFSVLGLQGCTKENLLISLDKYVELIQNEKTTFDTEMESQFQVNVHEKLAQVEAAKQEKEDLNKRILDLNNKILTLQQEAGSEEMKLRAQEANFQASADIIINEMVGDKQKITSYLQ